MLNKTATTLAFFALVAVGLIGLIVTQIYRPEAVGSLMSIVVIVIGLASTFVATMNTLGKQTTAIAEQGAVIDTIKTNTNGTLTAKELEIAHLRELLAAAGIHPPSATPAAGRHL